MPSSRINFSDFLRINWPNFVQFEQLQFKIRRRKSPLQCNTLGYVCIFSVTLNRGRQNICAHLQRKSLHLNVNTATLFARHNYNITVEKSNIFFVQLVSVNNHKTLINQPVCVHWRFERSIKWASSSSLCNCECISEQILNCTSAVYRNTERLLMS